MRNRTAELWELWHYFNAKYFGGKLTPPKAIRLTRSARNWGKMIYPDRIDTEYVPPVSIHIHANCPLDERVSTLLHEMVHQYQVQVLRVDGDHDDLFRKYCKWIERETGFYLRNPEP